MVWKGSDWGIGTQASVGPVVWNSTAYSNATISGADALFREHARVIGNKMRIM